MLTVVLALLAPAAASAAPGSGPTAIVSIGDSYISGEAGRWAGNSINPAGDRDGTDRTCAGQPVACSYDRSRVYLGGSAENGCHRSDVAEVLSAQVPVAERINIACSGAVADNVWRAGSGGRGRNGEPPQADQLLPIARAKDVRLVVVSVGGNDVGFASIVAACYQAYLSRQGPCNEEQQRRLDAAIPEAVRDVVKAIDEIRAVMAQAGYRDGDYRLVLQTYPSVIPRASEIRYREQSPERETFGCAFYDADLTWGRDRAAPQIGSLVRAAAAQRGVEVLELGDALQGHEFCSAGARPHTPTDRPPAAEAEWGRFLGASTIQQGDLQEAFHPNALAQQALGACLSGVFAQPPGTFACAGGAGRAPGSLRAVRTGDVAGAAGGGDPGAAGRGGLAQAPPCATASAPDAAVVRPRGRGLRVTLPVVAPGTVVDVFQQSRGRLVIGERLVARLRFRGRTATWSGRSRRRGVRATDGIYAVRVRLGRREGRSAVRRARGRFRTRPDYASSPGCGVVRRFKLERPVFGGTRNRALGIAFRLDRDARASVVVLRGRRVLRTYRERSVRARRLTRLRLGSEWVPRGDVRVVLRVRTAAGTVEQALVARRL